MKKLKLYKISLSLIISLVACTPNVIQISSNTHKESKIMKESNYLISGVVEFNNKFTTKATTDSVSQGATVSLIYPHDHPTNPNKTIATGLTDISGKFSINPTGFNPSIGEVYVLEALKLFGDKADKPISLRTYIKRISNGWESITTNSIRINQDTTSVVLLSDPDSGLSTSSVIGKISYINNVKQISDLSSNVKSDNVLTLSGIVESAINSDRDPISSIIKTGNDFLLDNENKSDIPTYVINKFNEAKTRYGNQLGVATTEIIRTESKTGYKQLFDNQGNKSILIYKDGTSQAFWILGAIFQSYIDKGGTFTLGYPITDELEGIVSSITNHGSRYQMFDGQSKPSLQYDKDAKKTFLMNKGIRDYWLNNQSILGLPIDNEVTNPIRQRFEGGTVFWNNGNPSVINLDNSSKEISIQNIQAFLDTYSGSLKEKDLFKQFPISNTTKTYDGWIVDYKNQLRSADPNNFYQRTNTGITTIVLQNGSASNMSPAEVIYYCSKENNVNPLLLLAKLQDEQSLIEIDKNTQTPITINGNVVWRQNFEERLYKATGYRINSNSSESNTGFYPQLVSLSYQFSLGMGKKSFDEAYLSYTPNQASLSRFKTIYSNYAQRMSQVSGITINTNPTISNGYEYFSSGTVSQNYASDCVSYPVGNPAGSKLGYYNASDFNNFVKGYGHHMGDDLNGVGGGDSDFGDPVYSIADGEVIGSGNYGKGWGNIIFIHHIIKGREYVSMYAHLKDMLVSKGTKVTRKMKIGTIGKGYNNVYSAHLHFELRDVEGIKTENRTIAGKAYSSTLWDETKKWNQGQIRPLTQDDGTGNIGFINKNLCAN